MKLLLILMTMIAFAAPKKLRPNDQKPVYPAIQVPEPIDDFRFTVTGEIDGEVFHASEVPSYYFRPYRVKAGGLPVNSEFKPEFIRSISGRHFYGFQKVAPKRGEPDQTIWVDGRFLKAERLTKK